MRRERPHDRLLGPRARAWVFLVFFVFLVTGRTAGRPRIASYGRVGVRGSSGPGSIGLGRFVGLGWLVGLRGFVRLRRLVKLVE